MSFDFHTFGWSNHILFFICSFIRGVVAVDVFPHIFYLYAMTIVFSEFIYWSSYRKICFNLLCLSLLSFVLEHICRFPNIDLIINLFFFDSNEFGSRSWFLPIEQLVFLLSVLMQGVLVCLGAPVCWICRRTSETWITTPTIPRGWAGFICWGKTQSVESRWFTSSQKTWNR